MDIVLLIIGIIIIILLVIVIAQIMKVEKGNINEISFTDLDGIKTQLENIQKDNTNAQSELRREVSSSIKDNMIFLSEQVTNSQTRSSDEQAKQITSMANSQRQQLEIVGKSQLEQLVSMKGSINQKLTDMDRNITNQLGQLEARFSTLETNIENRLQNVRTTVENQLKTIRDDNSKQLEQIRGTVDEKLQNTLETKMNDSFRLVSERLEQVYKGLGEMQSVAQGVGDLKKVLSNVKTRGILGEIQLGAILKEILTADQYDENIAVVPKSNNRVEFAVKLPGAEDGKYIYLPIDSKFNGDKFAQLQEAYDTGDKNTVTSAKKDLVDAIKKCAKDISDKYIAQPYTTQFAIMFLPFEGLYAEVVSSSGLVEELQRVYKVNVAGPSTMAAMLNSLKMGFQTLAVQRRSSEVWEVLGAVKTEFENFEKALTDTQERLRKTEDSLEKLVGVRTRQMNRKLSRIDKLDPEETYRILGSE